jgi:spermidine synthase
MELLLEKDADSFLALLSNVKEKYDMIIVDCFVKEIPNERVVAIKNSISALNNKGVLVLDDSEDYHFKDSIEFLRKSGFKQLDFYGLSPMLAPAGRCTSVFYREEKILGI